MQKRLVTLAWAWTSTHSIVPCEYMTPPVMNFWQNTQPHENLMLVIVSIGIGLTAATVMLHGLGTILWIKFMTKRQAAAKTPNTAATTEHRSPLSSRSIAWILFYTTIMLAALHIAEVAIWAAAYIFLPGIEGLKGPEQAFYYSMVTFTSLGYGDLVITNSWRILGGIQAMSGMIVFGWSSALLLTAFLKMLNASVEHTPSAS